MEVNLVMKTFEVAVPIEHCKKISIEPSDEFGKLMVVYKFPLDDVYLRKITKDIKANVLENNYKIENKTYKALRGDK